MKLEIAAKRLAELGNSTRLQIFKLLVRAGTKGMPVGEIQRKLKVPGSTLSHHIARLISVDLIKQRRDGATLYCIPAYDVLNEGA